MTLDIRLIFRRIMLIDLYERPYSPEAPRSRAFIDRILAISGPDGGVVGGEDGISTQRPLKDGGREAWDMIRRLRQKAWQKAGLNPRILWTEEEQFQAGVTPQADEFRHMHDPTYSGLSSLAASPIPATSPHQPSTPDPQLTNFNRMFYDMTRRHALSTSTTSAAMRPSPLRYSYQAPIRSSDALPAPRYNHNPAATAMSTARMSSTAAVSSPEILSPLETPFSYSSPNPPLQPPVLPPPRAQGAAALAGGQSPQDASFMDPISPNPPLMSVPTPPSMVDPNLNFDWDQWDAVFGQHLPVADELMELDPAVGLEFANFGFPTDSERH